MVLIETPLQKGVMERIADIQGWERGEFYLKKARIF